MSDSGFETVLKHPEKPGTGRVWCTKDASLLNDLGALVTLRRQSLQILNVLLATPEAIVSKEELLTAVWGNVVVGDDSISQCIVDIRKALDDTNHEIIRTHARRGYSIAIPQSKPSVGTRTQRRSKFGVSVFLDSSDGASEHVGAEICAELENALGHFSTLQLHFVARSVTSRTDLLEKINSFDTEYKVVLRPYLNSRKTTFGARVINGQTGLTVFDVKITLARAWTEREGQIGILANRIESIIIEDSALVASDRHPSTATDFYILGINKNPDTVACNEKARAAFEQALSLDADNPLAWSGLAETYFNDAFLEYTEDFDGAINSALSNVETAITHGPRASRPAWVAGRIFSLLKEWDLAEKSFERAIELNPYDADSQAMHGSFLLHVGRASESIPALKRSIALNPEFETRAYWALGAAYYSLEQYDAAIEALHGILIRRPSFTRPYRMVAASYAMLGQIDKAESIRELKLSDDSSNTMLSAETYMSRTTRYQRDIDLVLRGFQKAGFS